MSTAPGDACEKLDAFYAHWGHPVVHFGTPTLIVFAVLTTLAVVATPLLVGVGTPGASSAGTSPPLRGAYWLGVACLLFSAIEATIVFPLSRNVPWARHAPWTAGVSISLIAAAVSSASACSRSLESRRRKTVRHSGRGLEACV